MRFSSLPTLYNATRTLFLLCLLVIVAFFIVPQVASAQMTTIFSDDFTDTAGTPLATHNTNWTILEGVPQIQNNNLYMPDQSFIDIQLPSYDQCAAYDFQYPLIGRKELYLRARDTPSIFAQHGYYFLVDDWLPGEGNVHIADELGWVTEEFSLRNLSTGWHNFKACVIGTQLTAYIDNSVILTATARNHIADGYPRFRISPGNYIDNVVYAGTLSAPNTAPVVTLDVPQTTLNEGETFTASGNFTDPDSASWTGTVDYGDGSAPEPVQIYPDKTFTLTHQYTDNNPNNAAYTVTVVITDNQGASDTEPVTVTVTNGAPQVGTIIASVNPVLVNTTTTVSATFTDPGKVFDAPYTATWDWGDGTAPETVPAGWSNGAGSVATPHTYQTAGVYPVRVRVTDKDGAVSEWKNDLFVSVYSPTAQGLFSAGQKYTSPVGAYPQDPTATGTVMFGLSYKYQGDVPVGNRQFTMDFRAGNFAFNATTVSSLVIADGVGTLRGSGTVNGQGSYAFLVVGSEAANMIRMKITDPANNNAVIYDTQPGAADTAAPTTPVTAGNVLAH